MCRKYPKRGNDRLNLNPITNLNLSLNLNLDYFPMIKISYLARI